MGYVITRTDGTTDGLGDSIVFATEQEAWEAAARAFGRDPASQGQWLVWNDYAGVELGIYPGASADEAMRAMLADAGSDEEPSENLRAKPAGVRAWLKVVEIDG